MNQVKVYAAAKANDPLKPFVIQRRELGSHDVSIDIQYCGVCHSDVHQARDEWGGAIFPMVPGHEIVGKVSKIGCTLNPILLNFSTKYQVIFYKSINYD
jgi:alcohol dehydrogenase (NADP+)